MANRQNTFLLKRSNVPGKIPQPGDLNLGEIALNTADGILYTSGTTQNQILPIGWDRISRTGDTVTGNFTVNGNLDITSIDDVDYIDFSTTATTTGAVGRLRWNDTDGTLDLGLKGGNVSLQIGQEEVVRVVNKTGANLLESQYRVVRIRRADEGGSQGQRLAVVLAQGNNDANSVDTIGIVTENIAVNQEGFITTNGLVRNINTTGSLQGETWVDGDLLYLSPLTPGFLTKVKPIAPQHTIIMGYVVYANINQGKIFVKVDNGYELDELHNVQITGTTNDGDVLTYDSASSVWKPKAVPEFTGNTALNCIGDIHVTNLHSCSPLFINPNNEGNVYFGSTSGLTVDLNNNRVGVNINNPNYTFEVNGDSNLNGDVLVTGNLTYNGNLTVTGSTIIQSGLTVVDVLRLTTQPNSGYTTTQILMRNSTTGDIEITDSTSPSIYNYGMTYAISNGNYLT